MFYSLKFGVAHVNVDFIEMALVVAETGKVFLDMLPLAVDYRLHHPCKA